MNRRAFTLIELLVVIAIIAILAAILFPVFAQAKEAAKATAVLSSMKQVCVAEQLYMSDVDDVLPSYLTRNEVVANPPYRDDIVSWTQMFQPYMKNGAPRRPTSTTEVVPPQGMNFNPLWSQDKWVKGGLTADCDGIDLVATYGTPQWTHSHYGISFGVTNTQPTGVWASSYDSSAGTQANPVYYFAGSYFPYRASSASVGLNTSMNLSAVQRVAESAFITDGFTGSVSSGSFLITMGCEAQYMYKGGGNVGFEDGHAKFIKGNVERYLAQDSSGKWYKKYLTIDR